MSKAPQDNSPQSATYGAVVKLQWLRAIAGRSDLSRASLAACCVFADMADSKSGICWPSYNTIATAIGTTPRGTKKAIVQVIEAGVVTIAEHGNRVRSNRYRINLNVMRSEPQDTTSGSEPQDTRVVNASSSCSERQQPDVVNHSSPESIHLSEQQARDRWDRSQADGDSQSLRPKRPPLANQPGRFEEFWQAVGRSATVFESEQLLEELIADGVDYADILAGANRWRAYNEATGGRRATSPKKWLENKKWLDGWALPKPKSKAKAQAPSLSDGLDITPEQRKELKRYEEDMDRWKRSFPDERKKIGDLDKIAGQIGSVMREHFEQCDQCGSALKDMGGEDYLCPETIHLLCDVGADHFNEYDDVVEQMCDIEDQIGEHRPDEPEWLHEKYIARDKAKIQEQP